MEKKKTTNPRKNPMEKEQIISPHGNEEVQEDEEESNDEEEGTTKQQQTKPKKKNADTRKQIWIITILAGMTETVVTREMLAQKGIDLDEWFYAIAEDKPDQVIIIHTPRPVSAERIGNALDIVLGDRKKKTKRSTPRKFTLAGFDMLTSSGGPRKTDVDTDSPLRIENHPGFQRIAFIVNEINAGNEEDPDACFYFWIDKKDAGIFAFKKNLMLKSLPERKRKLENLNEANKGLRAAVNRAIAENTKLTEENTRLKRIMAQHGVSCDLLQA